MPWSITGTAGGQFLQAGGNSPTAATLVPTITYMASANATAGEIDTITVTAYAGPVLGDPTQDETLGTITAIETIEGGALQNGDFSQGLAHWANFGTVRNIQIGNAVRDSLGNSCLASELNNPFVYEDAYGTDSGIKQTFLLPAGATSISLTTWNNLDPVTVNRDVDRQQRHPACPGIAGPAQHADAAQSLRLLRLQLHRQLAREPDSKCGGICGNHRNSGTRVELPQRHQRHDCQLRQRRGEVAWPRIPAPGIAENVCAARAPHARFGH